MSTRIEITCPCGTVLIREPGDGLREIACPACGRINVLPPDAGEAAAGPGPAGAAEGPEGDGAETATLKARSSGDIAPGVRVGPYRVDRLIGAGAMGRVYCAFDLFLQRKVAVKVLSGELKEKQDFVARFQREARAVARLNHPNIVQIYFTGMHGELPYYAMEWVDGENLDTILGREGPLDAPRAVALMIGACRGLAAAAAEGIIHRDIKPSNLLLERGGTLKITDFGLAKSVKAASDLTLTGTIVGTPYYMSPEQGECRTVDHRSDIYSLGAAFYHLLAGSPPFEAGSPVSIILKHIHEELPSLELRNQKVPAGVAAVIRRMLAKDPNDRYPDYRELIDDLQSLQRGEEPAASGWQERPPSERRASSGQERRKTRSYIVEEDAFRSEPEEVRLVRTGHVRRFLAFALDAALLSGFLSVQQEVVRRPFAHGLCLAAGFLYFSIADAQGGATLGKTFFRCRVGRLDGEDLGLWRSLVRTVLFFGVLFGLSNLDIGLFDPVRRAADALVPASDLQARSALERVRELCAIWLVVDAGFLLFGPSRRALHDQLGGAFYFTKIKERRKPHGLLARADLERAEALARYRGPKDPVLAALLSTLCPGLGQVYIRDVLKGVLIFVTSIFILPWLFGIYHAYTKARWINRQLGASV